MSTNRESRSGRVPAKYPVKSLAKALRILDTVGRFQHGTSIAALSKELKMGKSTVHRLLATLREFDLIWFDPITSNYALGSRILRWSDLLVQQNLLVRHGLPVLRDLVSAGRETANLAVLDGTEVLYVAQFESMERLRMSEAVGTRQPAHSTALGKAILATLSESEVDQFYSKVEVLKGLTSNTITDKRRLKEHLQKVRNEGVAYDFEENVAGVVCLGAVVRNFTNKPIAAMSVSLPIQRLRGDNLITLKEHLLDAVNRLSAELGYNREEASLQIARTSGTPAEASA
ncbi:MAG TPA: IclR family transcriptional regulator [Candidatus Sulfotelmatobacter sp.]|nr:IclR family transcriptional regulator [Candidatus Sulfotelmatobacter sp.]